MANNGMTGVFVAADGTAFDFNNGTSTRLLGFDGVGMQDPTNWFQELPLLDGALYTGTRYGRRVVTLFIMLIGTSSADLHALERQMMDVLEPTRYNWTTSGVTLSTLNCGWADGVVRTIDVVYKSGATLSPDGRAGPYARKIALQFDAPRVYFRNANGYQDFNLNAPAGAVPKVNTAFVLPYPGSAPSYPIITITGPAVNPYVQNIGPDGTTRTFGLNYSVASSDKLVITFERGLVKVRLNPTSTSLGTDLMGYVTTVSGANPEVWTLLRGDNTILVKDQAGSPTATAKITYYENYMVL